MSLADEYINLRGRAERRGGDKPRNRGKQNAPNIEANWPGDEPNDNNVIPLGMYLEPPTAELTSRRIGGDASALNRAFGRERADDLPEHWADWAEGDNAGGDFQAQRRALIGSAGPLDPVAPRDPAHSLMIGEPIDELPTLEEARANTVRRRIGRLDEARFGLEPGTLGFVEPAVTGLREAVRDRDFGNALEGLGSAILADPSTGRRDPISRRNYDRVYGAPWGANLPGEDGLTDDQRASRRLADQMDPSFLGEDEITITASSRPERFGEAVGGLLAQDSWETPEARQRGLAEPFRDLGDLAVDLWTMPGRSQEEQAAREAGLLFDYSVSGSDMDLRAARQAAGEYGFNAASAGLELTPVGLAGDLASLGRVGARGVADALPARRLGETAPRAVDLPAPRDTSGAVDAEIAPPEPAPARRFEAALRDPETGEIYTGVDHVDAIESAPDGVRERLDAIYRAPSEDPNAVGFVVNGQFMSREEGLQALRASRRPVRVGEQVNRDGSVTERDPIDWDAPIAPERSALADMGIGRGPNDMQPPSINAAPQGNTPSPRAQQRPWTEAEIKRAQEMRAEGATVRAIGEALGRSAGDVSRRLSAGLAPPKARGFDPRLSPDEGYAAQRRLAGLTPAQIADEMELPAGQVRVALHQARRKAPDLSIPSIAIGAGIGGAVAFGDEAFAQMAGEDGILEIGGLEIDTNGELPSMRDAVGAPVVSGDLYVQEFSDGSRHVFRMNRDGERAQPEYVGELVGTSFEVPRVGEGGATYDPGMPSPDWPPLPEGDGLDAELSDGVRIGGTLTAGLVARLMTRRAGLGGVAGEIPGVSAAYGFNQVTGGDPVEGALLSGATPFAGRLAEYGAPRIGQAIDDTFYAPGQIARDNERLLSDPQFIMRRNEFAQTLPSAAPRARRLAVERDPLDGYASGRDPSGRMTDASEMLEQGYYADAAPQAVPPRVEFDTLPPAEQLAWMDRVGFAAPRAPAYPDRGNIGFVDGSSPEVEQMRRLGAPERADPFLQPSTGRSVFGEPRRQTVKPPPPPLAERAAERGSTGAMQGVKIAPMREIAEDLGIATEGVKAPELRRTLIRELARRFDSTAELVAFLRSYGVTAAALGIGIGGAQMVTEPEVTM